MFITPFTDAKGMRFLGKYDKVAFLQNQGGIKARARRISLEKLGEIR